MSVEGGGRRGRGQGEGREKKARRWMAGGWGRYRTALLSKQASMRPCPQFANAAFPTPVHTSLRPPHHEHVLRRTAGFEQYTVPQDTGVAALCSTQLCALQQGEREKGDGQCMSKQVKWVKVVVGEARVWARQAHTPLLSSSPVPSPLPLPLSLRTCLHLPFAPPLPLSLSLFPSPPPPPRPALPPHLCLCA